MLKIKQLKDGNFGNGFYIAVQFYIDRKVDALMLQKIIRSTLNDYCIEYPFGFSEIGEEIYEVDYACEPYRNELIIEYYQGEKNLRIKHMKRKSGTQKTQPKENED